MLPLLFKKKKKMRSPADNIHSFRSAGCTGLLLAGAAAAK